MTKAANLASFGNNVTVPEGSAPTYACRAWVNFNGTGTVAIRASGNVSSITDNGTGDYTVNFTSAMPDGNYAVNTGGTLNTGGGTNTPIAYQVYNNSSLSTGSIRVFCRDGGGTLTDSPFYFVSIFR